MVTPGPPTSTMRRSSSLTDIPPAAASSRRRRSSATLSSILTEDRLCEHAQRTARGASPYYRGLTDSGLYLRSLVGGSPDRESLGSSAGSGKSFSSTILIRMQHWGAACFSKRRIDEGKEDLTRRGAWDPGVKVKAKAKAKAAAVVQVVGKPLRESDAVIRPPRDEILREIDRDMVVPAPDVVTTPVKGEIVEDRGQERILKERDRAAGVVATSSANVEAKDEWSVVAMKTAGSEEREYVWGAKYRPRALKDFICNRERAEELRLASKQQCSHFIFEGPPGVGKRTMVLAFLREIFGPVKLKTKNVLKKIEIKGEHVTNINLNVKISSKHVEVNLSEVSGYEKHIIAALIKEPRPPLNKSEKSDHNNCRAIVLHEAEKISTDAQHYVRWLLEKYKGSNRIFFCCFDASKLQTIKHLCKIIKLQPPSDSEITEVLEFIAKKEHIELPLHLAGKIAENSMHNLRQAIRSFEASWKINYSFKENPQILTGWEEDIAAIARKIIEEQSPKQLYIIRNKLKNLIEHDVSPDFIFSTMIVELKKHLGDHLQAKIDALYREYSIASPKDNGFFSNVNQSSKLSSGKQPECGKKLHDLRIYHFMRIEEFTAKFMSCYKALITKDTG